MSRLQAAEAVAAQFEISDYDIQKHVDEFIRELNVGLAERVDTMCQIPTYITRVAYGTEKGFCLSVDLGGTDFQVRSVTLNGDSTYDTEETELVIPQDLMTAQSSHELFSFIAGHIKAFLEACHPEKLRSAKPLNLGFCFAFPFYQASVNSGVLIRWVKGFNIDDTVGKDVCKLLQDELDALQVPVRVAAIVNDTLGTIMARAYTLPVSQTRTSVGAIFANGGTNGAYLENLSKVTKDIGEHDSSTGNMFLNIEWGSFDNKFAVLSNNEYDQELNAISINKDTSRFEKRVSGIFLGELLRIAIEKLYDDSTVGLFPNYRRGDKSLILRTPWSVDTSIMVVAEKDRSTDLSKLKNKIQLTFGFPAWAITQQDAQVVQKVSKAIGRRAARLAGMAIGAVILQSGKLHSVDPLVQAAERDTSRRESQDAVEARIVDVAVDGSVFEDYPNFEQYMRQAISAIDGIGAEGEQRIRMGPVKDGSSIGTAITALLAAEQQDKMAA